MKNDFEKSLNEYPKKYKLNNIEKIIGTIGFVGGFAAAIYCGTHDLTPAEIGRAYAIPGGATITFAIDNLYRITRF